MAKVPAYAVFLDLINTSKRASQDSEFEGCTDILAFMAVKEGDGKIVKVTDLVQCLQFGTGPTVHRKVAVLQSRKLISITKNANDNRAKDLCLTADGLNFLKELTRLCKHCMES